MREMFIAALAASMAQVDHVIVNYVKPAQSVPRLMGADGASPTPAVTAYMNAVLAKYDAGSTAVKPEHIIPLFWTPIAPNDTYNFGVDVYSNSGKKYEAFPVVGLG